MTWLEKRLLRKLTTAIADFSMIKPWEIVLVWISWWKDSMALWYLLNEYRKKAKYKFEIRAIYIFRDFLVDCDIKFEEKKKYFEDVLDISLEKVKINLPLDSKLNKGMTQNCQWCSYARRIAMFKLCEKYWATKIIYGHHMDDIVVTTFMNMMQWRKLKIMPPKNKMNLWDITFIRPMAYIREKELINFVEQKKIPFSSSECPIWENSMRDKIKYWVIWKNEKDFPKYTENLFWAFIKDFREKYEETWYNM